MFANLAGKFIDKEAATTDTLKEAIEDVAEELKCEPTEFFFMIKAIDKEFNFKIFIYHAPQGKTPVLKREISVKEILGNKDAGE